MFDSIYSSTVTTPQFFLMAAIALAAGIFYAWIMSFRVRSTKRFFLVLALVPFVVAAVITFVNGNIGAGVAIGGAFSLIRFRSAQGSADEIAGILIAMGAGIAFGMGFVGYGVLILLALSVLFFLLSMLPIFEHKNMAEEQLLKITIPESLEYTGMLDDIFERYLKSCEKAGVKTTGMGSLFCLSYKIKLKDPVNEKALIDELNNSWIADSNMETIAATTRFGNFGVGSKISCFYLPFTEYNSFGERVAG
ncbi:MAG: DUF4956 domain-containing protein, partial [Clostridia bacterium]|nr:DUF4956 domain-containing protein [Clostridia bacterium]